MTDKSTTIAELKKHIQDFSDARGWRKDQNAKDLAMVGEKNEISKKKRYFRAMVTIV